MDNVTDITFSKVIDSNYVKPFRFNYTQNGMKKNWDLVESHGSVAILIFNVSRKKLIFVKQFRPTVYFNSTDKMENPIDTNKYPPSLGITLELCAGIIDKDKPLATIASEEVLEECGYKVDPSALEQVICYRSDVGCQGSIQCLYYCEVTDSMKVSQGGGVDDEFIEVVEYSIDEVANVILKPSEDVKPSPPAFFFALTWFMHNRAGNFL